MGEPPAGTQPFSLGHRPSLDGLRGVSILAVMAYHSGLIPGGYLGVDVFFALSGFLITALLLEEWQRSGAIAFGRFYMRRALRLLPALLALVVVCVAGTVAFALPEKARDVWGDAVAVLFYVANWAIVAGRPLYVLSHAWSLAIEEQFYLLWPPMLWLALRFTRDPRFPLALVVSAAAAGPAHRLLLQRHDAALARVYVGLDARGDSILLGCALALALAWRGLPCSAGATAALRIAGAAGAIVLLALFGLATFPETYLHHASSTLAALATALVIFGLLLPGGALSAALETRPLVEIGRISYGLYLWHFPIFYAWSALSIEGWKPDPTSILLAWASTFCVAAASFRWLERPALRLKERFSARSASPLA